MDLQECRNQIDQIDEKIVELLMERMELAKEVAEYKIKTGKPILDRQREKEKLEKLEQLADNTFNRTAIREVFPQLMAISRKKQYSLIHRKQEKENWISGLPIPIRFITEQDRKKESKVVFFGVRGSYSEQAMQEYFEGTKNSFSCTTFREVMQAVKDKKAEYGVLPIENSSTGGIADIYDLLIEYNNYIVGEYVLKIDNALLGLPEAQLSDICRVYSHAQPFLQCAEFLREHPQMQAIEYQSTAASAKKVSTEKDKTQGVIAGHKAAEVYGLKILADNISMDAANSTRFIIIANKSEFLKSSDKVSICFELPHESGTLYNMLSHFIFNGLNMTNIESRPITGKKWEYRFFVDFEGNLNDSGVQNALTGIFQEANQLRILGNYPSRQ